MNIFKVYKERDPSIRSYLEILLLPGFYAMGFYRISHFFYRIHFYFIARFISGLARWLTGIEIHPGATIGKRLMIDHGMGTVIGESSIIGNDCLIYQGVTLGGKSLAPGKRHPTLGNHVVAGAGSKILGNITIGDNVTVGANAVVVKDVAAGKVVAGIPAKEI